MKRIAILGSTGSIGVNTLRVIKDLPRHFQAVGLSTNTRIDIIRRQIDEFSPRFVCVADERRGSALKRSLNKKVKLFIGEEGILELIAQKEIDCVVLAISQSAALKPFVQCIACGKDIAVANKEALVMAGGLLMPQARAAGIKVLPIDSEQSALWQCLVGEDIRTLRKMYLTASGGPLRKMTRSRLRAVPRSAVLRHPRWRMGPKITVDSATLMNKGLEFIEAMALFGVAYDKIGVLIHPESIIHSMAEFTDGVIKAQLSVTDMRIPIQYALSYPQRYCSSAGRVDFIKLKQLHFEAPDTVRFPCLALAYEAAQAQGTLPAVLNAANEVSVQSFLAGRLGFGKIASVVSRVMDTHTRVSRPGLGEIMDADAWARSEAARIAGRFTYPGSAER